jgi:light-regulated signal transduction histidine kinase (bacteriophytochrome)
LQSSNNTEENRRVESLEAQLESLTEELEAFAFSVSHDLRAPVRQIGSFAELIAGRSADALDDKSTLYLQNIISSTERMSQLIDDLLAYSRVAKSAVKNIQFRLSELINEIIQEDLILESRGRKIQWNIKDLGEINGDPILLRQVFTNLMSNSIKFTRPVKNPEISIGRIIEPGENIIFIRDNGVGFNNKYAEKAFDVFYRLHQQDEFEGSGIGLAIVKRIVSICGGIVWAEGKENSGASFFMKLPDNSQI